MQSMAKIQKIEPNSENRKIEKGVHLTYFSSNQYFSTKRPKSQAEQSLLPYRRKSKNRFPRPPSPPSDFLAIPEHYKIFLNCVKMSKFNLLRQKSSKQKSPGIQGLPFLDEKNR
jgi:hypothetical protein